MADSTFQIEALVKQEPAGEPTPFEVYRIVVSKRVRRDLEKYLDSMPVARNSLTLLSKTAIHRIVNITEFGVIEDIGWDANGIVRVGIVALGATFDNRVSTNNKVMWP